MKPHLEARWGYAIEQELICYSFYLEHDCIVGIGAAGPAHALLLLPGNVPPESQGGHERQHTVKCPVAEVLGREVLEYELIPDFEIKRALSTPSYLQDLDFDTGTSAQVFLSFFLAAGNRILFKISRYPGEFLWRLKSVGGSPMRCW